MEMVLIIITTNDFNYYRIGYDIKTRLDLSR